MDSVRSLEVIPAAAFEVVAAAAGAADVEKTVRYREKDASGELRIKSQLGEGRIKSGLS